jgi:hypothetical protein
MEHQQSFSHGLLYSVAPEDIAQLHLNDESRLDELDWNEYESQPKDESYAKAVLTFLKVTASKWGWTYRG